MSQLHQKKRSESSLSDEWETPKDLYDSLCYKYGIFPELDVGANEYNKKCNDYLDEINELSPLDRKDIWSNPPHSLNSVFVVKLYYHWVHTNNNTILILPTNTMSSIYWHECIEGKAEYHPIKGRIKFLVNGEPSKYPSRNAYCVVIWRKRNA